MGEGGEVGALDIPERSGSSTTKPTGVGDVSTRQSGKGRGISR
jgi:hypothetical protein